MTTHTAHHSHRTLYFQIFGALMVLLVLTVVAAKFKLGDWNIIVALGIAFLKAALILLYFMHFRDSDRLTWLVAGSTLVWFMILILLTLNDYNSRGWMKIPGK